MDAVKAIHATLIQERKDLRGISFPFPLPAAGAFGLAGAFAVGAFGVP
jgi:hypothetical protein